MADQQTTELNEAQQRILRFITDFAQANGFPPTVSEIGKACGISSKGSVAFHLKVLEGKGFLKRLKTLSRGLEILRHPYRLPILGRVGAGGNVLAVENVEGYLSLDRRLVEGAEFLLRIKGDSMRDAGILDGDLVEVRRQSTASEGETVLALVGEEAVVKHLRRKGSQWFLESANPDYPPITRGFEVLGKVVGLIRQYEK